MFGVSPDRIALIAPPFPVEDFARLPSPGLFRSKYDIKDKRVVMFLGRLHWIKGIDFLVESFAELAKSRTDVLLAIVGPDDGYKSTLDKLIADLRLADRVLFTGFLGGNDKLAALVDADVVVQSSRYENAAWAPIEAVLCGTPVIVTKGSGSGEDVSRMGAGYLVEFGDKSQMAQTIRAILDDPSEAREKVRRAKEYINANLRFQHKVEEYETLYQQCREAARRRK
ncbi:MAG: glycosyltransferase family 4 protein [Chloroflexota bacterium]|nr:glycosyltransferase family 4 protein [Chloroflexota bacterium]